MSVRGLRNGLLSIVPNWLSNRPGLNNGFKVLYTIALMGDCMIEAALEGVRASWPGRGTPTALGLIAQGRGLIQGEAESNMAFSARLRAWLQTWQNAGSGEILAQQIQSYLANNPTVRVIDRAGLFVTANPDGTTSITTDTNWNWDSVSNPERAGWWSDIWIVISPAEWATYANASDPAWVGAWGTSTGFGIGHQTSRAAVNSILSLVSLWKGGHTYVQAIIWTTDTTLFVPGSLGISGNPDGTWGNWGKNVKGIQVPARTTQTGGGTVRYWIPNQGGA